MANCFVIDDPVRAAQPDRRRYHGDGSNVTLGTLKAQT